MKRLVYIFLLFLPAITARAQATLQRLVAEHTYKYDGTGYVVTDSSTYRYSGQRTSNMETGMHQYDTNTRYNTAAYARYSRLYDVADHITRHTYQQYNAGAWDNRTRFFYTYISTGSSYDTTLTQKSISNAWVDTRRERYIYTGMQLDTISRLASEDGNIWLPESRDIYGYNGGNMTDHLFEVWNDTLAQWDTWSKQVYRYDAANRVDTYWLQQIDVSTLTLKPVRMEAYAYDGSSNRIAGHAQYSWFAPSSTWEGIEDHLYTYNSNDDIDIETVNNWDFPSHSWGPYRRKTYNYDLSFNLANITEKQFDGSAFVNILKSEWLYNSNDLPTVYRYFQWSAASGGSWVAYVGDRSQIEYRYESYANSINSISPNNSLRMYPNPANGFVNISIQWQQSLPFTIQVFDMQGRLVHSQNYAAARNFSGMISLPGLQAGNYILRAGNRNEEMTKPLIIAGQ